MKNGFGTIDYQGCTGQGHPWGVVALDTVMELYESDDQGLDELEFHEDCDDGNIDPGDSCDENCRIEPVVSQNGCESREQAGFQNLDLTATDPCPSEAVVLAR